MPVQSEKIEFPGASGDVLAARLDSPSAPPRAYAVFAHCFTCSKDIFAASRISQELAARGIAVLRFDFTGLGASDGEFANTNFSSNVADLKAAVAYLASEHAAPQILVGHSLGGAAVLAAAGDLPGIKAVATIGAPSDTAHVVENFAAKLDEIEATGVAEVNLAGRAFTIKKQFLDDVRGQALSDKLKALHAALLIFHAPRDATVGIDNAGAIFAAAKHPKSFVSLDDADHLLSRRADAVYVARVLSAWASRFIAEADAEGKPLSLPGPTNVVQVAETGTSAFQQQVVAGAHELVADEPASVGGADTGPSPYDLLGAALGTCTSMTLRMYARHKKLALEHVRVDVSHNKVHAEDCAECGEGREGREGRIDRFERVVYLTGDLSPEQRTRLLEIADKCPVHQTMEKSSVVVSRLGDVA